MGPAALAGGGAVLATAVALGGCPQLLGWDDLKVAATADTALDAPVEVLPDTTAPEAEAGTTGVRWPDRPVGAAVPGGGKTLYWVTRRVFLSAHDHDGKSTPDAWRSWGYDLDGRCTTESSAPATHCKPVDDTLLSVDGDQCRDNNFGARFVGPVVEGTKRPLEDEFMASLIDGASTWVLRLDDLGDGDDDPYVPGALYLAGPSAAPPKFDGSETRTILSSSVMGDDLDKPLVRFPKGYLRDGTWVSGELSPADLVFPFGKRAFAPLSFRSMVLTTRVAKDRTTASGGVIAGALSIPAFTALVSPLAAGLGLCPGDPLYKSLVKSIARYPDLSLDADSLQDPTKTCDGISMGLGLEFAPLPPPSVLVPPAPPSATCDAGTD